RPARGPHPGRRHAPGPSIPQTMWVWTQAGSSGFEAAFIVERGVSRRLLLFQRGVVTGQPPAKEPAAYAARLAGSARRLGSPARLAGLARGLGSLARLAGLAFRRLGIAAGRRRWR